MSHRHAFRPETIEGLEDRKLLSHAGTSDVLHQAATAHVGVVQATAKAANLGPVGTLGDSFTDEYRFYAPDRSQARNWVENLSSTRGVNFGAFTTKSRGEPRDAGFAYNWARSDATTADMVSNQLPGLASQVARGQVRNAVILVGGNDFLLPLEAIARGALSPATYAESLPTITAQAGAVPETAVNTLRSANPNVRLVVATIDIANLPIVRGAEALFPALEPLVQAVNQAVGEYNNVIRAVAASTPRVALVDLAQVNQQLGQVSGTSISYGGATIQLASVGDNFHNFFLADGIHPGSVAQGIIANLFIGAFNGQFGTSIRPLSPQEIVRFAAKVQAQVHHGNNLP